MDLNLDQYPKTIKDLAEALNTTRAELREVEQAMKYRRAEIYLFDDFETTSDKKKELELITKLQKDKIYQTLLNREKELINRRDRLEVDYDYTRGQFSVAKLKFQERLMLLQADQETLLEV